MSTAAVSPNPGTTAPWAQNQDEGEPRTERGSKTVEWYQPTLNTLPATTVEVFTKYVGLSSEEEIKEHIYSVRGKAWDVLPYPCIGVFRFLDFSIHLSPLYPSVVSRLRRGQSLLDLGCCFGQDLRKAAFDAGTSANLHGADLEGHFLDLGYELFRDRDSFDAKLRPGDVFDESFLADWYGTMDMIYLGSFLHLFSRVQQAQIVAKLVQLLRPGPGALVFGRNLGAERGGEYRMEALGWDLYRHNDETIKELWASGADGRWEINSALSRYESGGWSNDRRGWQGDETKQMMFSATRL